MAKFRKQIINIDTNRGRHTIVNAPCRDGLAFHRDLTDDRYYTVTHISSGLALIRHCTQREALRAIDAALAVEDADWTQNEQYIRQNPDMYRPSLRAMKLAARDNVYVFESA